MSATPIIDSLTKANVELFLKTILLTTRERVCVRLRAKDKTYREIGLIIGLTGGRARQIVTKAERKSQRRIGRWLEVQYDPKS